MASIAEQHMAILRPASELTIKSSRTRRRYERKLTENLKASLSSHGVQNISFERLGGKIIISSPLPITPSALSNVFGLSSFSIVEGTCSPDLAEIVKTGKTLYFEKIKGKTFAVRGKTGGNKKFSSQDINVKLGAALNPAAKVNLDNPEITVYVDVGPETAYFYTSKIKCHGGLPAGVEGKALTLISGGFDSAAAAWLMLKRGVELDYLFCNLAGESYKKAVIKVVMHLCNEWSHGLSCRLHIADFTPIVEELQKKTSKSYWQIILKRQMMRIASKLALKFRLHAIITGESVGQVSSQTLSNLAVISNAASVSLLRPLAGMDKMEIIELTRKIGTYPLSEKICEHCALVQKKPATSSTEQILKKEEKDLDPDIINKTANSIETINLKEIKESDLFQENVLVNTIPENSIVIDMRTPEDFEAWHYPTALNIPWWETEDKILSMDPKKTYVLYCDVGIRSAHTAEKLRERGIDAFSLQGGLKNILK